MITRSVSTCIVLLACALGSSLFAQQRSSQKPPKTPPKTNQPGKPAPAPKPAPKQPQIIENSKYHYKFTAPGDWDVLQRDDEMVHLQLPVPLTGPFMNYGQFVVVSLTPCHPGATLAEQAEATRKDLAEKEKEAKIVKDEQTTFAGEAAWLMVVDRAKTYELTDDINGKPTKHTVSRRVREMSITSLHGGNFFDVSFDADVSQYDSKMAAVKKVLASAQWTDAAATQPTVN